MRAARLGSAIVMGLAIGATATGVAAQAAGAAVVNLCGQVQGGSPATDVTEGVSESNSTMHAFQESSNVTLASPLAVDITPPGNYPTTYNSTASLTTSSIPLGTSVDSYLAYSDPVGKPTVFVRYAATLTFATPVLGVIVQSATLSASDLSVGNNPGTHYSKNPFRGLELGTSAGSDSVELLSPTSLHVDVNTNMDIDSIRVVTAGSPSGATTFTGVTPHYTEVAPDGGLFAFGTPFYGSQGGSPLNKPMVGGAEACGTAGYWTVASDGGIFSFGATNFYGSTGNITLNKPVVGMAATPDGRGYWLVATDGGIFAYGDANFYGSTGAIHLNKPVVGMAATPDGRGYWLVASDGGIFAYGDANFYGSTGNITLNKPIVGMAATPDGLGYWLVASDGGIFAYGDANFYGSTGNIKLNQPIVAMKASPDGLGYWLFASDGGVFAYNAPFLGSMVGRSLNQPILGAF